jgi:excisionase family DNA binding protein
MDNVILTPIAVESLIERIAARTFELLNKSQEQQKTENKLFSVKELAKYAGVSELSIRNYIKAGSIQAKRIGRRILIDGKQFEDGLSEVKSLKYKR